MLAPVLPLLTDGTVQLDAALASIAAAGATGATVVPLHLRPGAREWFMAWLAADRPDLVPAYERLYARGAYVSRSYHDRLTDRVRPLLARHRLDGRTELRGRRQPTVVEPEHAPAQLTLL
jgi:DNA repair photolyase